MTNAYTREPMESGTGIAGTSRIDALYEEAKSAVGYAANELRALTEQARTEATPDAVQGHRVARLDDAVAGLERVWMSLGADGASAAPEPGGGSLAALQAQEEERARIAQEIHDGPAQSLANAVFQVEIVERLIDRDTPAALRELASLRDALENELQELRGLINQLRPRLLDELGLDGALRDAASELERDHEIRVQLDGATGALDEREQTVVLRVAQEALRNIRKHAGANRVVVLTETRDGTYSLDVADDGGGFNIEDAIRSSVGRSFGLRFMRERAESVGGTLSIESGATGTRVRLTITPSGERSSAW